MRLSGGKFIVFLAILIVGGVFALWNLSHERAIREVKEVREGISEVELQSVREVFLAQGEKEEARLEFEKATKYNVNYHPAKEVLSKL